MTQSKHERTVWHKGLFGIVGVVYHARAINPLVLATKGLNEDLEAFKARLTDEDYEEAHYTAKIIENNEPMDAPIIGKGRTRRMAVVNLYAQIATVKGWDETKNIDDIAE